MKRSHIIVIAGFLAIVLLVVVAIFLSRREATPSPVAQNTPIPKVEYNKGEASFFYPGDWKLSDQPVAPGFISAAVYDPVDFMVFTATSNPKPSAYKPNGTLDYKKDMTLGGVDGTERMWEDAKTKTVTFRADGFVFQHRSYYFELFTTATRKTKAEYEWKDILSSVKFATSTQETIQAKPK